MRSFNSLFKSMAVAASLVLCVGTSASAATLIANGGFETGMLDPWFVNGGTPVVTNAEANTGTYSVAAFSQDNIRQNFAATATNLIGEVSIWIKRAGGAFDQYSFYYDDASVGTFLIDDLGGSSDWNQFDLTSNLEAGKNLTGFSIFGTTSGPAYFDDVFIGNRMSPIPVPASLPLLLVGVGGLIAVRRRRKATV